MAKGGHVYCGNNIHGECERDHDHDEPITEPGDRDGEQGEAWVVYYWDMGVHITHVFPVDPADPERSELDARRACEEWKRVGLLPYGADAGEALK